MAVVGTDQVTIIDLTDGYSVNMSPESYAFPATATAAKAGSIPVLISALMGSTPANASVTLGEVTAPTGITVTKDANASTPTLTIAIATTVTAPGIVSIPVHVNDVVIVKKFAYSLAFTGAGGGAGVSATNVIVGAEDTSLPATPGGLVSALTTITIPFAGYVGSARAAATVTTGTLPSGMTVKTNTPATTSADGSLVLEVAANATLGGAAIRQGTFTLTFVSNSQTFTRYFSWSKSVAGTDGTNGADAIVIAITSSNGFIFKNSAIATTLVAHVYKAGTEVLGAPLTALGTLKWYKDGGAVAVGTGASLVLDAGQVTSKASYEVRLEV